MSASSCSLALSHANLLCSLGKELCVRAGLRADVLSDDLSEESWQAMHQQWLLWLELLGDSSRAFTATRDSETGKISVLGTYDQACDSVQAAVGPQYAGVQAAERFDQLRNTLQRAVKTAHKKLKGKIAALEKQKSAAVEAEATQKLADLFMANVYQWPKEASEMTVDDWETGAPSQQTAAHLQERMIALAAWVALT